MSVRDISLSVVVPCFNEANTLQVCIEKVLELRDHGVVLEIIIVDDASSDRSPEIARELAQAAAEIKVVRHKSNQGKGAALRTGFKAATGDFVVVQDADLEYDPRDILELLAPLVDGRADAVYGSRFLGGGRIGFCISGITWGISS